MPENKGRTQVVPDSWYSVLQKKSATSGEWLECGRLDVRNLQYEDGRSFEGKISEIWYLYTTGASGPGYNNTTRGVFRDLGSSGNAELDSIRLVKMAKRAGNEPTISHNKIVCVCDKAEFVPLKKTSGAAKKVRKRARTV